MKKFLLLIASTLLLIGCGSSKKVIIEYKTIYNKVDSIAWHDSTVYKEIPVERVKDVVPIYDTLHLETSLAEAKAYVDTTTHVLGGYLENKDVRIPVEIKWKEKIVTRDSIVVKEVPVEVVKEVTKYPKSYWIFMVIIALEVAYLVVKFYFKIVK